MAIKSKNEPTLAYSESAIRNNLSIVEYCRTSLAAVAGCTAGNIIFNLSGNVYVISYFLHRCFGLNWAVWGVIFPICCHSLLVHVATEGWD